MADYRAVARDLGIAARLGWRAARRSLGQRAPSPSAAATALRESMEPWLRSLPPGLLASHRFVRLPATQPPWTDSGITLVAGQPVTWFAAGRVFLSKPLDIWVDPSFQLWGRVGTDGSVFRGTRATHTFMAAHDGTLWLASYFPGEWSDQSGSITAPEGAYDTVSGELSVLVAAWQPGTDIAALLRQLVVDPQSPAPVRAEAARLACQVPTPEGWEYLWYLGPGEIYRSRESPQGERSIECHTHGDVGILRRAAQVPLEPRTELQWSWRVSELPTDLREDSLPSHDYLSIAVEFDDGQDLTYYWSAALPSGSVYRCPLPAWHDKETHVVVRSGAADLGRWLDERRDLYDDYHRIVGGAARSVVRVWLIANSLFQRGHGRCEYARIAVHGAKGTVRVL